MITFRVPGLPVPQGSKKIGRNRKTGAPVIIDDNSPKLKAWRSDVNDVARLNWKGPPLGDCCVEVRVTFMMRRPQRPKCKDGPCVKPDKDKLLRAVLDALTGVTFVDDAQVTDIVVRARWAPHGGECAVIGVGVARVDVG